MTQTKKIYRKAIAKIFGNRKMHMWNFLFRLAIVKILDIQGVFSVKSKQNNKYAKKQFLVP